MFSKLKHKFKSDAERIAERKISVELGLKYLEELFIIAVNNQRPNEKLNIETMAKHFTAQIAQQDCSQEDIDDSVRDFAEKLKTEMRIEAFSITEKLSAFEGQDFLSVGDRAKKQGVKIESLSLQDLDSYVKTQKQKVAELQEKKLREAISKILLSKVDSILELASQLIDLKDKQSQNVVGDTEEIALEAMKHATEFLENQVPLKIAEKDAAKKVRAEKLQRKYNKSNIPSGTTITIQSQLSQQATLEDLEHKELPKVQPPLVTKSAPTKYVNPSPVREHKYEELDSRNDQSTNFSGRKYSS
ncbi:MAG: hypothetical protein ABI597_07650 [Gammaproteobacteria bacterium]